MQFNDVAADAEGGAFEVDVVAGVLEVDEFAEHFIAVGFDAFADGEDGGFVGFGGAEAEDAGDGGDEEDVAAGDEVGGGGEAEAVEVVVA